MNYLQKKHRLSDNAFTRSRRLNFPTLILYLLNLRKHYNQVELDQFFNKRTVKGKGDGGNASKFKCFDEVGCAVRSM